MAAISGARSLNGQTIERLVSAWHVQGTPLLLTAGVILAASAVLGAAWVGAVVAALFLAGNAIVALEGRSLGVDEFAAISTLHAAAAIVLAISL